MLKYPCSFCCETFHENRRKPWTKEEDERLIDYIKKHGEGRWRYIPKKAGINRCGKSCRTRWLSCLRPVIHRGDFTREETELITKLHNVFGDKWSEIAKCLPGRTDSDIQSYWKTKTIIRKLLNRGHVEDHQASSSDDDNDDEVVLAQETENFIGRFLEPEEEVSEYNPDGEICAALNLDLAIGPPRV